MKRYLPASAACLMAAMPLPDPSDKLVWSLILPESVLAEEAVLLLHPVMAIIKRLPATNANPPPPRIERFTMSSSRGLIFRKTHIYHTFGLAYIET